jgi:hypothetical protein
MKTGVTSKQLNTHAPSTFGIDGWIFPSTKNIFCYTAFYTEEEFKAHRAEEHDDPDVHSDHYFLSPTLEAYYYCGFCQPSHSTNRVKWWL